MSQSEQTLGLWFDVELLKVAVKLVKEFPYSIEELEFLQANLLIAMKNGDKFSEKFKEYYYKSRNITQSIVQLIEKTGENGTLHEARKSGWSGYSANLSVWAKDTLDADKHKDQYVQQVQEALL